MTPNVLKLTENALSAVIVDDEELARRYLRELLEAQPGVRLAGECANGFEAVKSGRGHQARPVVPGRTNAQARRLRGAGIIGRRDGSRGDLRDRLRPVRDARLRRPRGGLSAEAVRRGSGWHAPSSAPANGVGSRQLAARSGCAGASRRRTPAPHRHQGRRARERDSDRETGLCGSAGRLRRAAQRRQELPQAAAHRGDRGDCSIRPPSCASTARRS